MAYKIVSLPERVVVFALRLVVFLADELGVRPLRATLRWFLAKCHTAFVVADLSIRLAAFLGAHSVRWAWLAARLILFALLLLPAWWTLLPWYVRSPRIQRGVRYGRHRRNDADVYSPRAGVAFCVCGSPSGGECACDPCSRPVVVAFSGGAWLIGYKMWAVATCRALAAAGVVVVACDYRNFPQATLSGMIEDVDAALSQVLPGPDSDEEGGEWGGQDAPADTRPHAELRQAVLAAGGDLSKVFVWGQSAGAHLVVATIIERAICDTLADLSLRQPAREREPSVEGGCYTSPVSTPTRGQPPSTQLHPRQFSHAGTSTNADAARASTLSLRSILPAVASSVRLARAVASDQDACYDSELGAVGEAVFGSTDEVISMETDNTNRMKRAACSSSAGSADGSPMFMLGAASPERGNDQIARRRLSTPEQSRPRRSDSVGSPASKPMSSEVLLTPARTSSQSGCVRQSVRASGGSEGQRLTRHDRCRSMSQLQEILDGGGVQVGHFPQAGAIAYTATPPRSSVRLLHADFDSSSTLLEIDGTANKLHLSIGNDVTATTSSDDVADTALAGTCARGAPPSVKVSAPLPSRRPLRVFALSGPYDLEEQASSISRRAGFMPSFLMTCFEHQTMRYSPTFWLAACAQAYVAMTTPEVERRASVEGTEGQQSPEPCTGTGAGSMPEPARISKTCVSSPTPFPPLNVSKHLPPLSLFHGDADNTVPHSSSTNFYTSLLRAGAKDVCLTLLPGEGHTSPALENPMGGSDPVLQTILYAMRADLLRLQRNADSVVRAGGAEGAEEGGTDLPPPSSISRLGAQEKLAPVVVLSLAKYVNPF